MIIILGTDVHGVKSVFLNGKTMNDIGKRAHVIKHSHGRCVVGAFDKILHGGYIWNVPRSVPSFILQKYIFLHFVHYGTKFCDKYINTDDRKNIDDDGSGIFLKQKYRKFYNTKYQEKCGNRHHVLSAPYIKYARIRRVYSGRKRKATGYVYIQGSPYLDAEGSSQLRSCLHDSIINASPRIFQGVDKL